MLETKSLESLAGPTARTSDERLAMGTMLGLAAIPIVLAALLIALARGGSAYPAAQIRIAGDGSTVSVAHWNAPRPEGVGVATWAVPESAVTALDGAPGAIELSGPFSAEVRLNGVLIGTKGQPGEDRASETPGPIDATISIPEDLLRTEGNTVVIRYSAHHLNYDPTHILQDLQLVRYDADPRRPLRYYGATLFSVGAVGALALALWRLARAHGDRRIELLSIGCLGFLVSAGAEVSRSFINYAYPWHAPRQAIVGLGVIAFCLCLAAFTAWRWPLGRQALRAGLAAIALCLAGALTLFAGFDARTSVAAGGICLVVLTWASFHGVRIDHSALVIAGLAAALVLTVSLTPVRFIDHQALVLTVASLGALALAAPNTLSPPPAENASVPAEDRVILKEDRARTIIAPTAAVLRLKAAGNYTEVHFENGEQRLDQRGISALLNEFPDDFLRIHKSHAVRLDAVTELRGSTGSRYAVRLSTGDELPVGRSRLKDIRAALSSAPSAPVGRAP